MLDSLHKLLDFIAEMWCKKEYGLPLNVVAGKCEIIFKLTSTKHQPLHAGLVGCPPCFESWS